MEKEPKRIILEVYEANDETFLFLDKNKWELISEDGKNIILKESFEPPF